MSETPANVCGCGALVAKPQTHCEKCLNELRPGLARAIRDNLPSTERVAEVTDEDQAAARAWVDEDEDRMHTDVYAAGGAMSIRSEAETAFAAGHAVQRERAERAEAEIDTWRDLGRTAINSAQSETTREAIRQRDEALAECERIEKNGMQVAYELRAENERLIRELGEWGARVADSRTHVGGLLAWLERLGADTTGHPAAEWLSDMEGGTDG